MVKSGIDYSVIWEFGPGLNPEKPGEWVISITTGLVLFFVTLVILPLVVWIMYKIFLFIATWLMAKFAAILGSEATTKQFRAIIGYSLAVIAAGEFLGIFFTLMGPSGGLTYPDYGDFAYYIAELYSSPALWIFKGLMVVLWLVFIIYSSISLRIIGKMAWVNAFVSVTVPVALFVFFFYFAGILG